MLHTQLTTNFEKLKEAEDEEQVDGPPDFMAYMERRDFVGAVTVLTFLRSSGQVPAGVQVNLWLAYCYFHMGKPEKALELYTEMRSHENGGLDQQTVDLYRAICMLYMGQTREARALAVKLPPSPLCNRLLFHACSRLLDEEALVTYHSKLRNITPDQMALAAVHYLRTHYQQALECYEEVLATDENAFAVLMGMALCRYRLGDYDACMQLLGEYREACEDSITSINLMAACKYRQGDIEGARKILERVGDDPEISSLPIYKHNMCIYTKMQAASHILPTLVGQVPEARANLVHLYVEEGKYEEAYRVVETFEPAVSSEYTLKAAAYGFYGQMAQNMDILQYSQAAYSTVGQSDADKDTMLGRRAMAASFFLTGEFDQACTYFESIADIPKEAEEQFNLNYGLALAASGKCEEAMQYLAGELTSKYFTPVHRTWLARLYVRAGRSRDAFELYQGAEKDHPQTLSLLRVLANECFAASQFEYAQRAAMLLKTMDRSNAEDYQQIVNSCAAAIELKRRGRTLAPPKMLLEQIE